MRNHSEHMRQEVHVDGGLTIGTWWELAGKQDTTVRVPPVVRDSLGASGKSNRDRQPGPFALALLLAAACAPETSQDVKVAPSADSHLEDIRLAVDRLNERAGGDPFSLSSVSDGHRRDGAVVVRSGDPSPYVATTDRTRKGVVIVLGRHVDARGIAHELGHAAGLKHHPDRGNLMYDDATATGWALEEWQVDVFH